MYLREGWRGGACGKRAASALLPPRVVLTSILVLPLIQPKMLDQVSASTGEYAPNRTMIATMIANMSRPCRDSSI